MKEMVFTNTNNEIKIQVSDKSISITEEKQVIVDTSRTTNYSCYNVEPKRIATIKYDLHTEITKSGNTFLCITAFIFAVILLVVGIYLFTLNDGVWAGVSCIIISIIAFIIGITNAPDEKATTNKSLLFLDSNEKIIFSKNLELPKEKLDELIHMIREVQ